MLVAFDMNPQDYRPDVVAPKIILEQPASEPVTITEMRVHVRQDTTADDTILASLVASARQWVENHTGRALISQRWQAYAPAFPDDDAPLIVPGGEIDDSPAPVFEYLNAANAWTMLASTEYVIEPATSENYAMVYPSFAAGRGWPTTPTEGDGRRRGGTGWGTRSVLRFAYTVGYGSASQVPEAIKLAIRLHAGWHYEHRHMPMSALQVQALYDFLAPYRLRAFGV